MPESTPDVAKRLSFLRCGLERVARAARLVLVLAGCGAAVMASGSPGWAAPAGAAAAAEPPPAKVQELLNLLSDPQVRGWIEQHGAAGTSPQGGSTDAPAATSDASRVRPSADADTLSATISTRLSAIRQHLIHLLDTIPAMPIELARAKLIFQSEFSRDGILQIAFLVAVFLAIGFGVERVYRRTVRPAHRWLVEGAALTSVGDRMRVVLLRLLLGVGLTGSFALGSVGAFLTFDWPLLLKQIILALLIAFVAMQLARAVGLFLLSPPARSRPRAESYRIVPITNASAAFWNKRLLVFAACLAFGAALIELLQALGFSTESQSILFDVLDFGLLLIALESIWRAPEGFVPGERPAFWQRLNRTTVTGLLSAYFVVLWLLWVTDAHDLFSLLMIVLLLPLSIDLGQRSVNHILRPPGAVREEGALQSVTAVILERGLRALLIGGAAVLLARAWQLDVLQMTMDDTLFTRMLRGVLNVVVVALVADLLWHVTRVLIDSKLQMTETPEGASSQETSQHARLRTLLPILRNVLFVVISVIGLMMALSTLGIQIAPLIASAGVVGVAVGFGSQTLVRDVLSGVFYLLDDAFRVGEYIQSGNYKGVVESFSLRSVKLRHHRGPVYTVPFGSLGAVQNMSRDWTIDKMAVNVAYDTDFNQVKGLIKGIGKQLLADPELAPHIIETLKMQGVESFGDYGVQIRMKMTTKPGEQFIVRRRALALIKIAFDENGISFAVPRVHVGNAENGMSLEASSAAARQSLELVKAARAPNPESSAA